MRSERSRVDQAWPSSRLADGRPMPKAGRRPGEQVTTFLPNTTHRALYDLANELVTASEGEPSELVGLAIVTLRAVAQEKEYAPSPRRPEGKQQPLPGTTDRPTTARNTAILAMGHLDGAAGYLDLLSGEAEAPWQPLLDRDMGSEALALASEVRSALAETPPVQAQSHASAHDVRHALDAAHESSCSCGGMGPNDPGRCGACDLYHTFRALIA